VWKIGSRLTERQHAGEKIADLLKQRLLQLS